MLFQNYRKISLICPGRVYGQTANLIVYIRGDLYTEGKGAYIREGKHFNLLSVKLTFLCFFQYKSTYFGIFHVVQDVKYVPS